MIYLPACGYIWLTSMANVGKYTVRPMDWFGYDLPCGEMLLGGKASQELPRSPIDQSTPTSANVLVHRKIHLNSEQNPVF